ncbi:radical SAM protein [Gordonia sp. PP30]|uniref:coproporphyrinogen-III oxidase family protein n=1 Tax=Gordonia sp. PP30 TaxID=2935861 RepID=UPI001FFF4C92|nr:coproporphyrinogen-III oxidase family protein [Gordonia sp. PP30]UQE73792.1 radical SAM protein [Gordonia sp. PP30]
MSLRAPSIPLPAEATGRLRSVGARPFGLYLHVPFCATRCGYCDFNTYTAGELGSSTSPAAWAEAVRRELDAAARLLSPARPVETIFVGGGTPSLLGAAGLADLLGAIRNSFDLAPGAEVTTESNPESTSPEFFDGLRAAGYTRISLGMQSAAPHVLRILERRHTPGRALEAAREAAAAGFEHLNLDLIYGTPGETDDDLAASLDAVLSVPVDHVSAYALIVEDGTAFARKVRRGEVPMPDDDVLAARYEQIDARLSAAGLTWYEVSNWAAAAGSGGFSTRPSASASDRLKGRTQPSASASDRIEGRTQPSASASDRIERRTRPSAGTSGRIEGLTQPSVSASGRIEGRTQPSASASGRIEGRTRPSAGASELSSPAEPVRSAATSRVEAAPDPDSVCRHNEAYWRSDDWWGIGPGAHSHVNGVRWWNQKHPATYAASLESGSLPVGGFEILTDDDTHTEQVMLRLRMRSGLPAGELTVDEADRAERAVSDGLLARTGGAYVLTDRGRLLADGVIRDILVD